MRRKKVTEANNRATIAEQRLHSATEEANHVTADVSEILQEQMLMLNEQLSKTKKQLLNVQERLTSSEQVTAATQVRELHEEGVYGKLLTENQDVHVYTKLLKDLNQLTTQRGTLLVTLLALPGQLKGQ